MGQHPITHYKNPKEPPCWVHIACKISDIHDLSSSWVLHLRPACRSPKVVKTDQGFLKNWSRDNTALPPELCSFLNFSSLKFSFRHLVEFHPLHTLQQVFTHDLASLWRLPLLLLSFRVKILYCALLAEKIPSILSLEG
jgi:hypothetical protein